MFNKFLPMTGFESQTYGIRSDSSTNWATTTADSYFYTAMVFPTLFSQTNEFEQNIY